MALPLPAQLSTDPAVNASAMAWAAQLVDTLSRGGGPWIEVGTANGPAFQGSWVNFGSPYATAAFYKDPLGRVHLRGMIKSGTIGVGAFFLPEGYRPPADLIFAVYSNAAFGWLIVTSAGVVNANGGSNLSFALNASFRAS